MAENKTKPTKVNVHDYINAIPHERKRTDGFYILEMMTRISGEKAVMWGPSGIGFGHYRYKYESGREGDSTYLGFSPRKAHLVLYVLNNFKGQDDLLKKLGKYKTGKICLYINKLADVDLEVLEKIVVASYKHAVKYENACG